MQETNAVHQVLVKLLDGKHRTLNFSSQSVPVQTLKQKIQTLTLIPAPLQLLLSSDSRCALQDHQTLDFGTGSQQKPVSENKSGNESGYFPVVIHVLLRLRGGKGGFGSLLRGAATKAGQKKTNNFDACRDMSGRRLRHVNAEKKLEEWKAESGERRLEKMAEDYIKNKAKEMAKKESGSRNKNGESTEKYVAKYREDSAKYVELIEKSVKESLKGCLSSKRKASDLNKSDAKKLKIWKGKRIMDSSDSDSEDSGDSDDDKDAEDTISVVIDNGSRSESSAEPSRSGKSAMCGKFDMARSEEDEKVNIVQGCSEVCITSTEGQTAQDDGQMETRLTPEHGCTSSPEEMLKMSDNEVSCNPELVLANEVVGQPTIQSTFVQDASEHSVSKPAVKEVEISATAPDKNLIMPLSFDGINSSAELEVLGMDRIKAELQARGLKCGGTLQERAARLFLLKTTPLDKLPKKFFCKK